MNDKLQRVRGPVSQAKVKLTSDCYGRLGNQLYLGSDAAIEVATR
jgi:hypothetical protein